MGKWNNVKFDRWTPINPHTLPYRIYKSYYNDLMGLVTSFESAKGYTYTHLKKDGALWNSNAHEFGILRDNKTKTIKNWSDNYKEFGNWVRLSLLLSSCSYLENYITAIVKECIDSDPGILIKSPHVSDGVKHQKYGLILQKETIESKVIACTKGTWQSRIDNLERLFGYLPISLKSSISELEAIRTIRNDLAHAFGRDIAESQDYLKVQKSPIRRLQTDRFNTFRTLINNIIKDLDAQLNKNHIGNYELLLHYHNIYDSIVDLDKGRRMEELKKSLCINQNTNCSKELCRGIISYYEAL